MVDLCRRSKLLTEKSLQEQFYVTPHISSNQKGRKSLCFWDQHSFCSLALCAGFGWGIENLLHLTSMKPRVQSLTRSVLCSALFDPCPSCILDEELKKAECSLCRSYSAALCTCRVPSHGWSFWHLVVSGCKGSQLAMQLCNANWLKQQCPGNQRIWESDEGLGFVTTEIFHW